MVITLSPLTCGILFRQARVAVFENSERRAYALIYLRMAKVRKGVLYPLQSFYFKKV